MKGETPWQLRMFHKSLKKKMRLKVLKDHLGELGIDEKCLLITCGDNNGAMNYYLRQLGGTWSFADLEDVCITEMSELLGEDVLFAKEDALEYGDATFDRVVTIDVHEHLDDHVPFSNEVSRITKPNGQVICTVPNGDESKIVVRMKHAVGMTADEYGHSKVGITIPELEEIMKASNVEPTRTSTFSRFFTETLELTINFLYVKFLSKRSDVPVEKGQIAPATQAQLKSVGKTYKIYSMLYPIYWLISRLDMLIGFTEGYVVVVEGRRSAV